MSQRYFVRIQNDDVSEDFVVKARSRPAAVNGGLDAFQAMHQTSTADLDDIADLSNAIPVDARGDD